MEEIEVPTEHLHETIEEKVEDAIKKNEKGWSMYVAISTALIAVLAAISALLGNFFSNSYCHISHCHLNEAKAAMVY
jgi:hypothetical protein